ncbi:hypothetical protein [Enterocloster lavalensis]|uniref:hypothetical protein n=1 Tax=Enterocloster lavalensis TaxID=460384 RepID=UPI0023F2BF56|nr:hypothetical protein [Enterocloster lavalensis]
MLNVMGRWRSLRAIAECNGPLAQPAGDCLGFEKTLNKTPSGCKMIKAAALKAERLFS